MPYREQAPDAEIIRTLEQLTEELEAQRQAVVDAERERDLAIGSKKALLIELGRLRKYCGQYNQDMVSRPYQRHWMTDLMCTFVVIVLLLRVVCLACGSPAGQTWAILEMFLYVATGAVTLAVATQRN